MLTDTATDISDLTIERIAVERLLSPTGAGSATELVSSPETLERAMEIAPLLLGEIRVTVTGVSHGTRVDRVVWSSNGDHPAPTPAPAPAPAPAPVTTPEAVTPAPAPKRAPAVKRPRKAATAAPAPKRGAKASKASAPASDAAKSSPPARRRTGR